MQLSSTANPRVKELAALRDRAGRDRAGQMLIEGAREIQQAIENGHCPTDLLVCRSLLGTGFEVDPAGLCGKCGARLVECSPAVMCKLSYRQHPDGLLAVAPAVGRGIETLDVPQPALVVVAEQVEKPGNLGAILRSADAAGAGAVLLTDPRTDLSNPNVIRASVGTVFSVPAACAAPERVWEWLRARGIRAVAATPAAGLLYTEIDLARPAAIVVGSEQAGLSPFWLERADAAVRIPMLGKADSLNVAAAATLMLYEAVRQRTSANPQNLSGVGSRAG